MSTYDSKPKTKPETRNTKLRMWNHPLTQLMSPHPIQTLIDSFGPDIKTRNPQPATRNPQPHLPLQLFSFRRTNDFDTTLQYDDVEGESEDESCSCCSMSGVLGVCAHATVKRGRKKRRNQGVDGPSQIRYVHYLEAVLYGQVCVCTCVCVCVCVFACVRACCIWTRVCRSR